jgi:hypothetical protein
MRGVFSLLENRARPTQEPWLRSPTLTIYGRPIYYADPSARDREAEIESIIEWLRSKRISFLNIAGGTKDSFDFLRQLFRRAAQGRRDGDNFAPAKVSGR